MYNNGLLAKIRTMPATAAIGTAPKARVSLMGTRVGYEDAWWARLTAYEITEAAHLVRPAPLPGVPLKISRGDDLPVIISWAGSC